MVEGTSLPASGRRVGISGRWLMLLTVAAASLVLAGCASRVARAPIQDMSSGSATATAPAASSGASYVVRPGDTLYKIAQSNNIEVTRLAQINNIHDPSQLRVGQVLRLDGAPAPASDGTAVATPIVPAEPVRPVTPTQDSPGSIVRADDANLINWAWPTQGRIIQGFNASTKGIDIEGKPGDPVLAAADGKVMYAGNGVRGLGNLILLGHTDGFITAYAHNQELLVQTGQEISRGSRIATIGETDTTSPRLHFEIRRRGTPVNPLSYLPARPGAS